MSICLFITYVIVIVLSKEYKLKKYFCFPMTLSITFDKRSIWFNISFIKSIYFIYICTIFCYLPRFLVSHHTSLVSAVTKWKKTKQLIIQHFILKICKVGFEIVFWSINFNNICQSV